MWIFYGDNGTPLKFCIIINLNYVILDEAWGHRIRGYAHDLLPLGASNEASDEKRDSKNFFHCDQGFKV